MKNNLIDEIFKILPLYESANDKDSNVTEEDYLRYLQRQIVRFEGRDNDKITDTLKGLFKLGTTLNHDNVKSIVFDLIKAVGEEAR